MPSKTRALVLVIAWALIACSGEPDPNATQSEADRPATARLIAQNLELLPGTELAARIAVEAADDAAHIIVTSALPIARISVCPLTALDAALPDITRCRRDIPSGVREPVGITGMRAIALVVAGDAAVRAHVLLEFAERGRAIEIVLPRIRAPAGPACGDNACTAFFELVPPVGGPFRARAAWDGPDATLVLLQGSVLGRSRTATGIPYGEPARADGPSPLEIETTLAAPAEYALVLRHRTLRPGEASLENVRLRISWPSRPA